MTTQSGMDAVVQQLGALAAQMEQIRLQGAQQTTANEQLAAQVARIQDHMDHPLGENFTGLHSALLLRSPGLSPRLQMWIRTGQLQSVNVQKWCSSLAEQTSSSTGRSFWSVCCRVRIHHFAGGYFGGRGSSSQATHSVTF